MGNKISIQDEYWNKVETGGEVEKKYTSLGEYKPNKLEIDINDNIAQQYIISYPEELSTIEKAWPLIIIVNGSNDITPNHYNFNYHISSHGFIVIGNNDKSSGSGESTSKMLDYILNLNQDESNILYKKIDIEKIGIIGGSQGGAGAIKAVTEFENGKKYKTLITISTPRLEMAKNLKWEYDPRKINIPWFQLAGTGFADSNVINPICPLSSLKENYDMVKEGIACCYVRRKNIDHSDMIQYGDGYMIAWLCYFLLGDKFASRAFSGNNPEIKNNEKNWQDVAIKNIA